jgi:small GTP-binding protein
MKRNFTYKIVVGGDGAVGKTTLLHRYIEGRFREGFQMTLGVEFFTKDIELDEDNYCLSIWDLGGQERFRDLVKCYIEGFYGSIIAFDLSRYNTLKNVEDWCVKLEMENNHVPFILIGTKADLMTEDAMRKLEAPIQKIRDRHNFLAYFTTSSKTGLNVEETFSCLLNKIIENEAMIPKTC